MAIVNNCLLCFKEIENESVPNHSPKLLELCLKYLHSSFAQDLHSQSSKNPFPLCSKCFRSAEELVEINEQIEYFQKRISELVFIFSLEILHRRGHTTVFSDKFSEDNAKCKKNVIEFDVSLFPNCDYFNNSSPSEKSISQPRNLHISDHNANKNEISDPLLIPVTLANENHIDLVIEEIKFEDVQQNFVDDKVDPEEDYHNCENAVLPKSWGKEKELHSFFTAKVNNEMLPIIKLKKLEFYNWEGQVTTLEIGSVNSISAYGEIGEINFPTVWTRCELGDSYRCINKCTSSENSSEGLESSKNFTISNDGQISAIVEKVDASVSRTKSSSNFVKPNYQLTSSTEQLPSTVLNKVFKTEQTVLENTVTCTGEPPFKCNICDKEFTIRSYLLLHTKCHSDLKLPKYDESHSVSNCKQSLKVRKRVNNLRRPAGENPYSCDLCKRRFKNRWLLLRHERTHTGEKPYKCDVCDRRFAAQDNMVAHKRLHTGEKPYKCDVCDRTFAHRSTFSRHKMLHTGDKPFKCDTCDFASHVRSSLKTHKIVKHSDSMNFKCRECKKDFKTAALVKQHYKGVHFALDFSDDCIIKIT